MRVPARIKNAQERLAYRLAVRGCLEVHYGQSVAESHANAEAWWGRISKTSAFKSGYFMHSEPISTAGRIAGKPVVELNERDYKAYEKLIDECWKLAHNSGGLGDKIHELSGEVVAAS